MNQNKYETYAVTINPSPYKKWDKQEVNNLYKSYGRITAANYNKLPEFIQKQLLLCILDAMVKQFLLLDWCAPVFEKTDLGNLHIHVYFKRLVTPVNEFKSKSFEDCFRDCTPVRYIEQIFGAASAGHPCVYVEKTIVDINYWKDYMAKEKYLEVLMNLKIDADEDRPLSPELERFHRRKFKYQDPLCVSDTEED